MAPPNSPSVTPKVMVKSCLIMRRVTVIGTVLLRGRLASVRRLNGMIKVTFRGRPVVTLILLNVSGLKWCLKKARSLIVSPRRLPLTRRRGRGETVFVMIVRFLVSCTKIIRRLPVTTLWRRRFMTRLCSSLRPLIKFHRWGTRKFMSISLRKTASSVMKRPVQRFAVVTNARLPRVTPLYALGRSRFRVIVKLLSRFRLILLLIRRLEPVRMVRTLTRLIERVLTLSRPFTTVTRLEPILLRFRCWTRFSSVPFTRSRRR